MALVPGDAVEVSFCLSSVYMQQLVNFKDYSDSG
jgi:hypothetical protein